MKVPEFALTEEHWNAMYGISYRNQVGAITMEQAVEEAKELLLPEIVKLLVQNALEKALDEYERTA